MVSERSPLSLRLTLSALRESTNIVAHHATMRSPSSARSPRRSPIRTIAKSYLAPLMAIAVLMAVMLALGVVLVGVQVLGAVFRHFQI